MLSAYRDELGGTDMTEKKKNIRSLITTLAVLLAVTTLFFVFFYAILPLAEQMSKSNGGIGTYICYNRPQTLEEYEEIVEKKNKRSLDEVDVSYKLSSTVYYIAMEDGGFNMLNVYRPQYVARFEGFEDCFIAEYEGYNYEDENYIVMKCDVLDSDLDFSDVLVCIRTKNAPTCLEFEAAFEKNKRFSMSELRENYYLVYDSYIEYSWAHFGDFTYMYLLLSDGVALINIVDTYDSYVKDIIPYEEATNVHGIPARALIDLFNEYERSEG